MQSFNFTPTLQLQEADYNYEVGVCIKLPPLCMEAIFLELRFSPLTQKNI